MIAGTIDFTAGYLPRLTAFAGALGRAGPVEVLADLRLDEPEELAAAFGCAPDASPADIVAAAWLSRKEAALPLLRGDFALAIVDHRTGEVVLARDHVGIRPLYWYRHGRELRFSGDLADLVARCPEAPIDDVFFAAQLIRPFALLPAMNVRTLHVGLLKLPGGHVAVFGGRRETRVTRWMNWWNCPDVRFRKIDDYAEALRERLSHSIRRAVRTEGPIASHLSGGIDGTAVTILADKHLRLDGRKLDRAYTWFAGPSEDVPGGEDTWSLAKLVAQNLSVPLHEMPATFDSQFAMAAADPFGRPMHMLDYEMRVLAHASSHGVGVILSGWGGDEVVSTRRLAGWHDLLRCGRWYMAARLWRAGIRPRRSLKAALLGWGRHGVLGPFLPSLPMGDTIFLRALSLPFIHQDMVERVLVDDDYAPMRRVRAERGYRPTLISQLEDGHLARRCESWAMAAADYGITHRYPLLDRELLAFCLGLPPELPYIDGRPRALLRLALKTLVPHEIREGDKPRETNRVARLARADDLALDRLLEQARHTEAPSLDWIDSECIGRVLAHRGAGPVDRLIQRQAATVVLAARGWKNVLR
ncbi:asparagine synthase-related protein [Tistrella mobilis]|uniref:asparagine synthase-related protein n=1 Tax=Tistrella mobilis TaxID=171437 RepID=UPI0035585EC1